MSEPLPTVPGYEIGDLIARGGAGEVYQARDTAIGHDVAIKLLFPGAAPVVRWRFLEEARIQGQLQHPGIPPVHHVGETPDGRQFMVTKLIKGRTLADIIHDEPKLPSTRLPAFVQIFEQLCQTIAYAHSRRVVHRDIKPRNVMIGAFGEVLVMDWGLAMVLAEQPVPPVPTIEQAAHTARLGSILGTPLYMPPEQARGQPADERSDVFGLGGILCHILTGAAPFRGENPAEVLHTAAAGDLADAFSRLDSCGADPELIDLCKRCLSSEPANRPSDACEVARLVSTYGIVAEDRERDAAVAAGRATEQRKRRRVQLALALVVALWLVTLGVLWKVLGSK